MSLYGPKITLPKVDIPSPGRPSWNLEKEKKLVVIAAVVIIVIIALVLVVPILAQGASGFLDSAFNPSIQVNWKNNPLDLTKGATNAEMDLTIQNTTKETKTISFNITTPSKEIIVFCPNSIFDVNSGNYLLENVSAGDKREVPCLIRRNSNEPILTGSYTLSINTNLGNTKTSLEVVSK